MASLRFLQLMLLNEVLSSLFKVSLASTPMTAMSVNTTSFINAANSVTNPSTISSSDASSTFVAANDATPSSGSNKPSTEQTFNQNTLGENFTSLSTISVNTTASSVPAANTMTTSSEITTATASSTRSGISSTETNAVVTSLSVETTGVSSVTNISVTENYSRVAVESTSPRATSLTVSVISRENVTGSVTIVTPLTSTVKQQTSVASSVNTTATQPTTSVTTEGLIKTTSVMSSERSSRTEATFPTTSVSTSSPTRVVSTSSSVESTETTANSAVTTYGNSLAWIAAPVIIGVLLVVGIIVVIVVLRRRRRAEEPKYHKRGQYSNAGVLNPTFRIDDDSERPQPPAVRVQDFINHVAELHRDSDYGFASEFSLLAKLSPQHSKTAAELPENRTKNRFTNILPFDHARVRLIPVDDDEDGGSDYINASFLPGFSSRREFIAAQGPMKSTVDDFWRMIWEYNVTTIVMVTNMFERGREKCAQYWPEQNDPIYYGDVQVEQISESSLNYYVIRIFSVKSGQESRRLMQFQFLTWPDFGVPKEPDHLLSFLTQVRNSIPHDANQPILVHCSAGVGRTGTFIVIDHVLQLIIHQTEIDMFGLVLDMRNNRPNMIQAEAQYIFAHECIRYALEHGYHLGKHDFLLAGADDSSTGNPEESLYMNSNERK